VELKPAQASNPSGTTSQFESNQSGIETLFKQPLDPSLGQFESNQSGIETRFAHYSASHELSFESNQSGIETLYTAAGLQMPTTSLNRTRVELKLRNENLPVLDGSV